MPLNNIKGEDRMDKQISLRVAKLTDAERLVDIYAPYVQKTAITFEDVVPSVDEFRHRIANTLCTYPYLVAESNGKILGYAYVGRFGERKAYDWAVETSIYVAPDARHTGIGGRLYAAIEKICQLMGITNLYACIAYPTAKDPYLTPNSVEFHHHLGYRKVGEFRSCGSKFGRWYDMVWMEKMLAKHETTPTPVKNFNQLLSDPSKPLQKILK